MIKPQEATAAAKGALQALAKSGASDAADTIRQHLAAPALAHFSVSRLSVVSSRREIGKSNAALALYIGQTSNLLLSAWGFLFTYISRVPMAKT